MKIMITISFILVLFTSGIALSQTEYALSFNGASYVSIPDKSINVSGDFTVECWVNFSSLNQEQQILIKNDQPSDNNGSAYEVGLIKWGSDNKIHLQIGCTTYQNVYEAISSTAVSANQWYHIAGTIQGTTMTLYINGSQVATTVFLETRRADNNNANVYLGTSINSSGNPLQETLSGKLDEVRIWSIARTQTEIHDNMNRTLTGNETGLNAYYKMSDGSGTTLTDNQSNVTNNPGTITNATWISSDAPLPVELTSFTGKINGSSVTLNWQTATEVNNYGFNVELRIANGEWKKIGFVQGHGNSNSPKEYLFTDSSPLAGNVQYRLKQIDINGAYGYSKVVAINVDAPNALILEQNYPNPFNPTSIIRYEIPQTGFVKISVYDGLGKEIRVLVNEEKSPGHYEIIFDAKELASGIYFYTIRTADFIQSKKMIILR